MFPSSLHSYLVASSVCAEVGGGMASHADNSCKPILIIEQVADAAGTGEPKYMEPMSNGNRDQLLHICGM
jgi:hypothetical protein